MVEYLLSVLEAPGSMLSTGSELKIKEATLFIANHYNPLLSAHKLYCLSL